MTNILLSFIPSIFFLVIKIAFNGVRFSDTNVYFYTAAELLRGKLLYKDIFFTNLPLFPYISSLYVFLTGGKIELYYLTATIEAIGIGILLFFIVLHKTGKPLYGVIAQFLYLFSFIILSTSDHQTGVFLASLFSILAYLCYVKKRSFLTGLFLGCMVLTKAYYLPVAIAFFIYFFLKEKTQLLKVIIGFLIVCVFALLPFIFLTGKDFIKDIFLYSLFRSQGIDKLKMLIFFITHDLLLFLGLCTSLIAVRKHLLLFLINIFSLLLIFIYKDVYYLYLNIFVPFLVLSLVENIRCIDTSNYKPIMYIVYILVTLGLLKNITTYITSYANLQRISNLEEIVLVLKKEKPEYVYGTMEVTPALAYLSGTSLLDNIIDTNDNIFYKGVLNTQTLTKKLFSKKTILVTKGVNYPLNDIYKPVVGPVADERTVLQQCKRILASPIKTEGIINIITLFKCY